MNACMHLKGYPLGPRMPFLKMIVRADPSEAAPAQGCLRRHRRRRVQQGVVLEESWALYCKANGG
jgi:hypothetical protein